MQVVPPTPVKIAIKETINITANVAFLKASMDEVISPRSASKILSWWVTNMIERINMMIPAMAIRAERATTVHPHLLRAATGN